MGRRALAVLLLLVTIAVISSTAESLQQPWGGWWSAPRTATPDSFDGSFQFCRVMFQRHPFGDGARWDVDYPRADINFSIRLSELTTTPVSVNAAGDPNHVVVRLTDPELFRCPFIMMTEVGAAYLDDAEAAALRDYLLKGGFLWADDFWGTRAWEVWIRELRKALPAGEHPIVDLAADHPLYRVHFQVPAVPQIPSINFWSWTGATSERGADSAVPRARAIVGRNNRLLVLMTHNTDVGDSWEREADDPQYFYLFSVDGYAFGINTLIYAMSH